MSGVRVSHHPPVFLGRLNEAKAAFRQARDKGVSLETIKAVGSKLKIINTDPKDTFCVPALKKSSYLVNF